MNSTIKSDWVFCEACNKDVKYWFKNAETFTSGHDFAYTTIEDGKLFIVFKGSDDFKDWLNNMKCVKQIEAGKTIHSGFYESWIGFKNWVNDIIKSNPLSTPNVRGHSRGGALAVLCARHIAKNLLVPCSCVTYGCPRIGNKKFRDELHLLPIDLTMVKMQYDIICKLAPKIFGYADIGKEIIIKQLITSALPIFYERNHFRYRDI